MQKVYNFFRKFFNGYMAFVLIVLFFVSPFTGYTFQRNYALGDMLHMAVGAIAAAAIILWIKKAKNSNSKIFYFINNKFGLIVGIGFLATLAIGAFVDFGGYFIVGWDTRNVIFPELQMDSDYMSMYPNQIFLAGLFRRIMEFCDSIGISEFGDYYLVLVLLSTFIVELSAVMIAYIGKKLMGNLGGICCYIAAAIFLGLGPYIMVPYSDTFGLFCTTTVLFFYIVVKNPYIKWFSIFFVALIGTAIKPTVLFCLLAILFVEFVHVFRKRKIQIRAVVNTIICAILIAGSLWCANFTINKVCDYGVEINENDNFTPTHFLMMGINMETRGGWNINDVNFSRSFSTIEEREKGNIEVWKQRLQEYGPLGVSWILLNKTLTNFADGSFAWECETPWNMDNCGNNPVVWFLYGIDPWFQHNDNNNYMAYPWQCIWMGILIGATLTWFGKRPKKEEVMMCCSMLAISAFLTIFEPDPRYIYLYVPYLIILAVMGWKRSVNAIQPDEKLVYAINWIRTKVRKNDKPKKSDNSKNQLKTN